MLVAISDVLSKDQAADALTRLKAEEWIDGKATAGTQSALAKRNRQLAQGNPLASELGATIVAALNRNALFMSAA
jgi:PKHD-type hydroxylase